LHKKKYASKIKSTQETQLMQVKNKSTHAQVMQLMQAALHSKNATIAGTDSIFHATNASGIQ